MPAVKPEHLQPGDAVAIIRDLTASPSAGTVSFSAGRVVAAAEPGSPGVEVDAAGWMLLPPLADVHAHLDKAYTWDAVGRPEGSLADAVACWADFGASHGGEQIAANARRQLTAALGAGVTAMRSHVNYYPGDDPLRGVRALVALREEFRGLVDLQIVAMGGAAHPDSLLREAIALGVDLLGGAPHLSPDPEAEIRRTVRLAEEAGIGVDVHTDENLDPDSQGLVSLARLTAHWPQDRRRDAGHCVSLAVQTPERLREVLSVAAGAGVGIVTNPLTNLYLQGWDHRPPVPRALPPLREIVEAGVPLAAGGDNVQDPFNPLGNGDMVDVVVSLVLAGHLPPALAWDIASTAGRRMMGLPDARGRVGDVADGILVRAASIAEAIAERAPDRIVIRDGRVIARRLTETVTVPVGVDRP